MSAELKRIGGLLQVKFSSYNTCTIPISLFKNLRIKKEKDGFIHIKLYYGENDCINLVCEMFRSEKNYEHIYENYLKQIAMNREEYLWDEIK